MSDLVTRLLEQCDEEMHLSVSASNSSTHVTPRVYALPGDDSVLSDSPAKPPPTLLRPKLFASLENLSAVSAFARRAPALRHSVASDAPRKLQQPRISPRLKSSPRHLERSLSSGSIESMEWSHADDGEESGICGCL